MGAKAQSAQEIAGRIRDGDAIGFSCNGSGMGEPDILLEAIERRFLRSGHPRDLTLVHSLGFGDGRTSGLNRFAHEGMVRTAIGAHFSWGPKLQAMIRDDLIEAYCFPAGVIQGILRETGAGRPGLITHVGLGTFADPRQGGGRGNRASNRDLVEIIHLDGEEKLRYRPIPLDVALLRGTYGDHRGNLSLEEEALCLDAYSVATAAHNSGGQVFAQVRELVWTEQMPPRTVRIPGIMVDAVAVHPGQEQTYLGGYDLSISGQTRRAVTVEELAVPTNPSRRIIAARALEELEAGASVNFGFGIPGGIPALGAGTAVFDAVWYSVEQGVHNGVMLDGPEFGAAYNAEAIIGSTEQFDYYSGGGIDISFLGMGEVDGRGNVNVSHLGGKLIGPGGFVDISQNSGKVVFCGTFDVKGAEVEIAAGKLRVRRAGEIRKMVDRVAAITFNGDYARARNQAVLYITERAVFKLTETGVELTETAPGIDIEADILPYMGFKPIIRRVGTMDPDLFRANTGAGCRRHGDRFRNSGNEVG